MDFVPEESKAPVDSQAQNLFRKHRDSLGENEPNKNLFTKKSRNSVNKNQRYYKQDDDLMDELEDEESAMPESRNFKLYQAEVDALRSAGNAPTLQDDDIDDHGSQDQDFQRENLAEDRRSLGDQARDAETRPEDGAVISPSQSAEMVINQNTESEENQREDPLHQL